MARLQIYRELLPLATFLRVHLNSKEVSYLSWQKKYPNLKTACYINCYIKTKCLLWTKFLEILVLSKYLTSVATALINWRYNMCFESLLFSIFSLWPFSIWTCGYLFQRFLKTGSFRLKEHEAVFWNRQSLIFSILAGGIWFVFYFRLNIFTSMISNMLLPLEALRGRSQELWILIYPNAKMNDWLNLFRLILQSWPNFLRQTLVLVWNRALREKVNFNFCTVFC